MTTPASRPPEPEERDSLRLGEYIWMIRQGKWIILAFVVVSLLSSIYITMRTAPVYQSSATFLFDFSNNITQALDFPAVFWFEVESAKNNQIQILRSRSMAEAIADSILRAPDSDSLVMLLFNGLPPPDHALRGSLVGLASGSISVSVMKDSDFFVLSAFGASPEASAVLANIAVHTYYRRNLEEARGENREIREFLENQLATVEAQLAADEESLRVFKESRGFIDLPTETRETVSSLVTLETAARTAETQAGALQAQRDYLTASLDSFRDGMGEEMAAVNDAAVSTLMSELSFLESSRAELMASGGGESEAMRDLDRQVGIRRDMLAAALSGLAASRLPSDPAGAVQAMVLELASVEAALRAERTRSSILRGQAWRIEGELSTLPEEELELTRLERSRSVSENLYILLRTRYEEIRIAEAGQIGNVTIVDTALPGGLVRPSRQRNLMMGLFVGLALGIGVVFLRQQLDTSVSSPEQIEDLGVSLLGVIPHLPRTVFPQRTDPASMSPALVTHFSPRDPISEAYRDLRTGMLFARADAPVRCLLVTSAGPREGKSTTSANLAIAFAQSGQRCVIVDADLRRPVMHSLFGREREPGLSEAVAGLQPLQACIRRGVLENLDILPCGFIPHNPSELLGGARMKELIAALRAEYDITIIDSPPMAVVTDALLLGPEVDGTLLVVGARIGNRRVLQTALGKLRRSSAFIIGAVLNDFDPLRMYTSYGYYTYRYYHYYYSEGARKRRGSRRR